MNRKQRRTEKKKSKAAPQPPDTGADEPGHAPGGQESEIELLYRQILRKAPHDPFALHSLGIHAHQAGRNDIAVDLMKRAIALNGQMPDFHYNLAIVLKAQDRLDEAAASYEHALTLKQDYPEAHNNLGNLLKAQGKLKQAMTSFERALACKPGYFETHYNLGILLYDLGEPDAAAVHLHSCLKSDPNDTMGARLLLARLGLAATPLRASQGHMKKLYNNRAPVWDQEKHYRGHALVAQALRKLALHSGLNILDAGCGTGLAGALVRDLADRLDGVDISSAMLEIAQKKQIYDHLYQDELVSFMTSNTSSYDAVVSAATLIHFGDLAPVFLAAAACLKNDGLFIFTLFPNEDAKSSEDFIVAQNPNLAKGGCFAHRSGYVARLADATGFAVHRLDTEIHEHDQNNVPISGLIVALRRAI